METPLFVQNDPWLQPHTTTISNWLEFAEKIEQEICAGKTLNEFARGHEWFGLHRVSGGWIFRDWAPFATEIFLIGDFNNWQEQNDFRLHATKNSNWELQLPAEALKHGQLYALSMHWAGGTGKRIPAWCRRVVQDENTLVFNAQVWQPEEIYSWKNTDFKRTNDAPLIYEAHVGMAGEEERVHSFNEFRTQILPRIKEAGYNTVQLMAIPEHPYYGSFGYHVSSFFAPSSRFGSPEELKQLIDDAHEMGLAVIMDLVHSHAVKNETEGLGRYDGSRFQFFHDGAKGEHPAWDSYCFNYGKPEVLHFLLSNITYWIEEFKFDGFRFDGVTSMLYFDHGLGKAFTCYDDYFNPNVDREAVAYFRMANKLIHEINPQALSIAEEMSGLPGLAVSIGQGGLGFDYRMAMGVPDYWIKIIKEQADEDWNMGQLFHELTSKRPDEKVVSYAESHDQALVGDKTIIFRLIDKEMYFSMRKDQPNLIVERGLALHKMIRMATVATAGGAYLNFMGNEFGHPEWIDFPREGNQWSYQHARRLWYLTENHDLRYHWLNDFDQALMQFCGANQLLQISDVYWVHDHNDNKVLAFRRGDFLFVFNFHPTQSFTHYGLEMPASKYRIILNTDEERFGGQNRIDQTAWYYTQAEAGISGNHFLRLYLPARTAMVLQNHPIKKVREN